MNLKVPLFAFAKVEVADQVNKKLSQDSPLA